MTSLIDIRDRTLNLLRALGVDPLDDGQARTVERFVRWVDQEVSAAHIDGRRMDADVLAGHEVVVSHEEDGAEYRAGCHEAVGADCRLDCPEGCESWVIERDERGPHHFVNTLADPIRHELVDGGECAFVAFMEDETGEYGSGWFEVGRFRVRPVWDAAGYYRWERAT